MQARENALHTENTIVAPQRDFKIEVLIPYGLGMLVLVLVFWYGVRSSVC